MFQNEDLLNSSNSEKQNLSIEDANIRTPSYDRKLPEIPDDIYKASLKVRGFFTSVSGDVNVVFCSIQFVGKMKNWFINYKKFVPSFDIFPKKSISSKY